MEESIKDVTMVTKDITQNAIVLSDKNDQEMNLIMYNYLIENKLRKTAKTFAEEKKIKNIKAIHNLEFFGEVLSQVHTMILDGEFIEAAKITKQHVTGVTGMNISLLLYQHYYAEQAYFGNINEANQILRKFIVKELEQITNNYGLNKLTDKIFNKIKFSKLE